MSSGDTGRSELNGCNDIPGKIKEKTHPTIHRYKSALQGKWENIGKQRRSNLTEIGFPKDVRSGLISELNKPE